MALGIPGGARRSTVILLRSLKPTSCSEPCKCRRAGIASTSNSSPWRELWPILLILPLSSDFPDDRKRPAALCPQKAQARNNCVLTWSRNTLPATMSFIPPFPPCTVAIVSPSLTREHLCGANFGMLFRCDGDRFLFESAYNIPVAPEEHQRQRGWFQSKAVLNDVLQKKCQSTAPTSVARLVRALRFDWEEPRRTSQCRCSRTMN
jgi:hypothetical protein